MYTNTSRIHPKIIEIIWLLIKEGHQIGSDNEEKIYSLRYYVIGQPSKHTLGPLLKFLEPSCLL